MATSVRRSRTNGKENVTNSLHNTEVREGTPQRKPVRAQQHTPVATAKRRGSQAPTAVTPSEPTSTPQRKYERTSDMPSVAELLQDYRPTAMTPSHREHTAGECQYIARQLWKRVHQLEVELINTQEDAIAYEKEYRDIKDKGSQLYDVYMSSQATLTDLKSKNEKLLLQAEQAQQLVEEIEAQAGEHQEEWKARFEEQEELLERCEARIAALQEENRLLLLHQADNFPSTVTTRKRKSSGFMDAAVALDSFSDEDEEEDPGWPYAYPERNN